MLCIGMKVNLSNLFKPPRENAEVIDILPANIVPSSDLVELYYGPNVHNMAFEAIRHNRFIIQKTDGAYVVLTDSLSYPIGMYCRLA